jgi:hypothetical protein
VGPLGVAIGRWPDANRFVFKGDIGELQLWRYDPVRTATEFLDCCCSRDVAPLQEVLTALRDRGVGWGQAIASARAAQQATLELVQAIRAAGPAAVSELAGVVAATRVALLRRDRHRMAELRRRAQLMVDASAGSTVRSNWEQRVDHIAHDIGLGRPQQDAALHALCLDVFAPHDDRPRHDPSPPLEGGPWDHVPTPEPLTPPDREVD